MYQLKYPITNELYDRLMSELSSETKNDINSLLQEINDDTSNSNFISVRVLSNDECNKYIVNETLDGTISKGNINVWKYNNAVMPNQQKWGNTSTYYYGYCEINLDNTSNNCSMWHKNGYYSKTVVLELDGYRYNFSFSQTKVNPKSMSVSTQGYRYGSNVWTTAYNYFCFRPVIQYIDNRKSTNVLL